MKQLFFNKISVFLLCLVTIASACVPTTQQELPTKPTLAQRPSAVQPVSQPAVQPVENQEQEEVQDSEKNTNVEQPQPDVQSDVVIKDVPFTSQAPFQVWDELHGEACEEASMLMVVRFLEGVENITPHDAEQVFIKNVRWQEQNGYSIDLTVAETQEVLSRYFDVASRIITDVSVERIMELLDTGSVVIAPAGGRLLGNPHFQTPGPIYHMLVIKGYDRTTQEFIANDPGTRHGENFRYSFDILYNAIHDWDHDLANDHDGMTDKDIASTPKRILAIP